MKICFGNCQDCHQRDIDFSIDLMHRASLVSKIPYRMRVVKSKYRQEERVEEEDRSQALDLSTGSDHRWIEENLHDL